MAVERGIFTLHASVGQRLHDRGDSARVIADQILPRWFGVGRSAGDAQVLFERSVAHLGRQSAQPVEQLVATQLPVWLSFRRCRHGLCGVYGEHWGGPEGDAFGRAARRFEQMGVRALLINCIPPDHVAGMVSYLRDFVDLPLGVYPNLGYYTDRGWRFDPGVGGAEYAELALRWRDVDFSGSLVRVRASHAAGQLTSPKSGKVRSVPTGMPSDTAICS